MAPSEGATERDMAKENLFHKKEHLLTSKKILKKDGKFRTRLLNG